MRTCSDCLKYHHIPATQIDPPESNCRFLDSTVDTSKEHIKATRFWEWGGDDAIDDCPGFDGMTDREGAIRFNRMGY